MGDDTVDPAAQWKFSKANQNVLAALAVLICRVDDPELCLAFLR